VWLNANPVASMQRGGGCADATAYIGTHQRSKPSGTRCAALFTFLKP
jgi:hypothetical protein